jgi:NAD(P)-dependent dehydrogenase (short-subunit alcohol dehydrogenase family)
MHAAWTKYSNQVLTATDYTVPAMEVDIVEVRQTFETNLFSVITMCQTFLPLLIKAKGTIVQIGSVAGVSLRNLQLQKITPLNYS